MDKLLNYCFTSEVFIMSFAFWDAASIIQQPPPAFPPPSQLIMGLCFVFISKLYAFLANLSVCTNMLSSSVRLGNT